MQKHKLRPERLLAVFFFLFAFPTTTQAHTTIKGLGEVVNGLIHPVTTPSHLLILLGLGLLAGQQSPLNLKLPMLVFVPLSAVALLLSTTGIITAVYQPVLICVALGAGIFVALEAPPPRLVYLAVFAAAALAIGLDSRVEAGSTFAVLKTLAGTWISLNLLVFDFAYYVSLWRKEKWQKIGIRVMGSWLIAISLLVLAFSLRK